MKNSTNSNRFSTLLLLLMIVLLSTNSMVIAQDNTGAVHQIDDNRELHILPQDQMGDTRRDRVPGSTYSWYSVSGIAFHPYSNTTSFTYKGEGCIGSSATDDFHSTFHLPDGAVIKEVYFNYYNMPATVQTELIIYRSSFDGNSTEIAHLISRTGTTTGEGYFDEFENDITTYNLVNNMNYTYNIAWSGSSTQRLCGVNIGYIAPSIFGVALPLIQNN